MQKIEREKSRRQKELHMHGTCFRVDGSKVKISVKRKTMLQPLIILNSVCSYLDFLSALLKYIFHAVLCFLSLKNIHAIKWIHVMLKIDITRTRMNGRTRIIGGKACLSCCLSSSGES
jgi:hypothetical protein